MKNKTALAILLALSLGGGACVNFKYPESKPMPALNFTNLEPYRLNNGGADVVAVAYRSDETIKAEQEIGFSPTNTMTRYLINRFDTITPTKTLMVQIEKSELSKKTEQTGPLEFMVGLTKDHYFMDMEVALYPLDKALQQQSPYRLTLKQELVMSENVSLADRERRLFEWMEEAITKMDTGITDIVTNNF